MEPKTILKAEIRNIEIHVIQLSERGYQCTWKSKSDKPIQTVIGEDFNKHRTRDIIHPENVQALINRPVALNTATRRFRKLVKAAQDPRITFEAV